MIAFLRGESGADVVSEILLDAESRCYAHSLNLCEVFYDFERTAGREQALQAVSDLANVGVVEDANFATPVWQEAGSLKARIRRISWADGFAIELANRFPRGARRGRRAQTWTSALQVVFGLLEEA